ncbi:MAG: hypothetical protein WCC84_02605 [Candidatus Cybelea sp.]
MKRWNLIHYAMSGCVTAALLAGCGGSQPPLGQSAPRPETAGQAGYNGTTARSITRLSSLKGETFMATDLRRRCRPDGVAKLTFTAIGNATGPLPGTFKSSGIAHVVNVRGYRGHFKDTFVIDSSGVHYGAAIHNGGAFPIGCSPPNFNVSAKYSLKQGHGDSGTTEVILTDHSFSQTFQ